MAALSRGARTRRLRRAAAARGAARLDHRAHGARHRADDEPALLRPVQSRARIFRRSAPTASRACSIRSWRAPAHRPCPVELEGHVIRAVARPRRASAPRRPGISPPAARRPITPPCSARSPRRSRDFAQRRRARLSAAPPMFYTSRDCHIAWLKIAHQAGVGAARCVWSTPMARGRMDPNALAAAIAADRAAGAVSGHGRRDRRHHRRRHDRSAAACADIARAEGLWYHVDAAWGGAALASDRLRGAAARASSGPTRSPSTRTSGSRPPWAARMFITRHGRHPVARLSRLHRASCPRACRSSTPT